MGIYVLAWLQNSHDTEGLEAYIIKRDCLMVAKNPVVICEKAVAGVVGQGGGQDRRAYPPPSLWINQGLCTVLRKLF